MEEVCIHWGKCLLEKYNESFENCEADSRPGIILLSIRLRKFCASGKCKKYEATRKNDYDYSI